MKLLALLPVKPLDQAKSRLMTVLSETEREQFAREGLLRTLRVLRSVPAIWQVVVVSADPQIWKIAQEKDAAVIKEQTVPGLNRSLELAQSHPWYPEADALLVLPIDLPRLNAPRLSARINALTSPGVVIVPDRFQQGTNVLLMSPPGLIAFAFGEGSFQAHCALARAAGIEPQILPCPDLGLDVDSPDDLACYQAERSAADAIEAG